MNILFAYNLSNNDNEFVHIHIEILQNLGMNVQASKQDFWEPTGAYDLIVINWPDYLFSWRNDITDDEVTRFNTALSGWRICGVKILTFFHDEYSHFGRSANLNLIFNLCYAKSDILVHLGEYSLNKYKDIYKSASHYIIHHPVYQSFLLNADRFTCRENLKIKKNEMVLIVPGAIRNKEEINYCLKILSKISYSNKKLVFLRTSWLSKPDRLRTLIDLKSLVYYFVIKNKYKYLHKVFCHNGYMSVEKLSQYFMASDAVIIPRTDILNSGNIILAAQFGKPLVGTGNGNMGELLSYLEQLIVPEDHMDTSPLVLQRNSAAESREMKKLIKAYAGNEVLAQQWKELLNI